MIFCFDTIKLKCQEKNLLKTKFEEVKNLINQNNLNVDIEIDGGVTLDNLKEVLSWGANVIVAGSAIYNSKNATDATMKFKKIMGAN